MCEARVNIVAERNKILLNPSLFSFLAVIRPPASRLQTTAFSSLSIYIYSLTSPTHSSKTPT